MPNVAMNGGNRPTEIRSPLTSPQPSPAPRPPITARGHGKSRRLARRDLGDIGTKRGRAIRLPVAIDGSRRGLSGPFGAAELDFDLDWHGFGAAEGLDRRDHDAGHGAEGGDDHMNVLDAHDLQVGNRKIDLPA